ncbi:MAG: Ig-like domain repeat protein, partial [Planctomycetes bacterium]|nr:Ig-like domain repeat protein [Planctomycetota bacterium]
FATSHSAAITAPTEALAQTSTTLTLDPSSPANPVYGQAVSFDVSISNTSGTGVVPFRYAYFYADRQYNSDGSLAAPGNFLGYQVLDSNGNAVFSTSAIPAGSHTVTALFNRNGTGGFAPSHSAALSLVISPTPPQLEQAAPGQVAVAGGVRQLTNAMLAPIVQEAIQRWQAVGLSRAQVAALDLVRVRVVHFTNPTILGEAEPGVVLLSADAAGFGWFVDGTPADDQEFSLRLAPTEVEAASASPAAGHMDLLTVVLHELGHELGLPDLDPAAHPFDLMDGQLALGVRREPGYGEATSAAALLEKWFAGRAGTPPGQGEDVQGWL